MRTLHPCLHPYLHPCPLLSSWYPIKSSHYWNIGLFSKHDSVMRLSSKDEILNLSPKHVQFLFDSCLFWGPLIFWKRNQVLLVNYFTCGCFSRKTWPKASSTPLSVYLVHIVCLCHLIIEYIYIVCILGVLLYATTIMDTRENVLLQWNYCINVPWCNRLKPFHFEVILELQRSSVALFCALTVLALLTSCITREHL